MIPEIGVMIQHKVRKKKTPGLMLMLKESETWLFNV